MTTYDVRSVADYEISSSIWGAYFIILVLKGDYLLFTPKNLVGLFLQFLGLLADRH